jgi:phospholipid/cholesterol/gamma-HCH transport system substrate-binding protein
MKISNETKIGALTAVAITVLILGFNFLKGKSLTSHKNKLYAVFPNVEGLLVSNPVFINGLQVGKVVELQEQDKNISGIVVTISLAKDVNIPRNSIATISSELLGTTSLKIHLGVGTAYTRDGDTLLTRKIAGVIDQFQTSLNPVIDNLNKTLGSVDDVLQKINTIFDPNTRGNLQSIISNLALSSKSLELLLNTETGILSKSLVNLEALTRGLSKNTGKIDTTLLNLQSVSAKLNNAKIDEAVDNLAKTLDRLEHAISKLDSKEGTAGLLLNDRQMYDDLRKSIRSLNTLLDDVRVNPKRYVNISVFGRKDKKGPLSSPADTTLFR